MIKINLLPIEEELKQVKATQEVVVFFAAVLLSIVVLFLHNSSLSSELKKIRNDIMAATDKINSMKDVETLHKTIQEQKAQIATKLSAVKQVTDSQTTFVRHLDEMQNIIPNGIWFSSMSFTGSSSVFECKATSYYEISDLYNRIKSSEFFSIGDFPSISEASPESGMTVYKFKLASNLNNLTIRTKQSEE